jgi:UMF1 family MFS transporter
MDTVQCLRIILTSLVVEETLIMAVATVEEVPGEDLIMAVETEQEVVKRSCYPRWRGKPVYHGNPEALGWALDAIGRSVAFIGAGAFLGTALLRLAKEAAGCETDPPPGSNKIPDCDGRVYGIRPSSLLTTYTIVVGLVSALLMPFMGAIIDYTPHRLRVGQWLSVVFCILLVPQIFINENTWFAVAIIQIAVAFTGWAQTMVTYAYLPELTRSDVILNEYTQSFTILSFGSMVLYLGGVVGVSTLAGFGDDDIATAHLGVSVSFGVSSVLLYLSWGKLLKKRPAARELPVDRSLWTAGFIQVYHTSIHIYKHFPALKWFYVSVAFVDAGINSLATIAITYLTDKLGFSSQENGIAILLMLIGSIPGAIAAGRTTKRYNPIFSSIVATLILALNTIGAGIVLKEPGQQMETYIFACVWGLGSGWKWTTDRLLASVLIPPGQDAELMGVFLFAGQILTWLPPLVFTVLNEVGVSQRIGIGTLAVYFLLGAIALVLMGSYPAAVAVAGRIHSPLPAETANEGQSAKGKLNHVETEEEGQSDRIEVQPEDHDEGVTVEDSPPKSDVGE